MVVLPNGPDGLTVILASANTTHPNGLANGSTRSGATNCLPLP